MIFSTRKKSYNPYTVGTEFDGTASRRLTAELNDDIMKIYSLYLKDTHGNVSGMADEYGELLNEYK